MFQWLSSRIFRLKLIWGIGLFLSTLACSFAVTILKRKQTFLLMVLLLGLVGASMYLSVSSTFAPDKRYILRKPSHTQRLNTHTQQLSYNQTLEKYQEMRLLLQIQPNHRDVLINASLLAEQLGYAGEAQQYWLQAQRLDPNNPMFTE